MEEVRLTSQTISASKLMSLLLPTLAGDKALRLTVSSDRSGMDPAVLVALIGVAGTTITSLLTGIFAILEKARASKLSLTTKDGRTFELPANSSAERLRDLIDVLETSKVTAISIDR